MVDATNSNIENTEETPSDTFSQIKQFFFLFVPSATLLGLTLATYHAVHTSANRIVLKSHEQVSVKLAQKLIHREFETITSDLHFLANSCLLQNFLSTSDISFRNDLGAKFLNLLKSKRLYDQIRYIDETGMEKIRVNFNNGRPKIVPKKMLQNKQRRYYFEDTFNLAKGEVFVSPLDLNVEHGEIEQPLKPMLRIGTPVFDENNQKRGIVLLNYFGSILLKYIRATFESNSLNEPSAQATGGTPMLLNAEGYWLLASNPQDEWGFMFNNDRSFAKSFPDEWVTISASENGQLETPHGLFTFTSIYPLMETHVSSSGTPVPFAPSEYSVNHKNYYWKLISFFKKENLVLDDDFKALLGFYLLLILFVAVACWHLARYRLKHVRAEKVIRRSEEKFRTVSDFTYAWEYWIDPDGNFVYISPSCERVSGYSQNDFMDQPELLVNIVHPEDRHLISKHLHEELISENVCEIDYRIIRKNGEERNIAHICQPVYGRRKKYLGRRASNRDITKRVEAEQLLKKQAFYDSLTQLPNRNLLFDRLKHALAIASRNNLKIAILFLDVDDFKEINDTLGHESGDNVLSEIAKRLRESIRETDTVARLGGDEFVVVLEDIESIDNITLIAEKLINRTGSPITLDNSQKTLGISIGISIFPDHGDTVQVLIKSADAAMYEAKKTGKNCYRISETPEN